MSLLQKRMPFSQSQQVHCSLLCHLLLEMLGHVGEIVFLSIKLLVQIRNRNKHLCLRYAFMLGAVHFYELQALMKTAEGAQHLTKIDPKERQS